MISVVMSTIGRSTLDDAVQDIVSQLGPNDELIVVSDGAALWQLFPPQVFVVTLPYRTNDYGCTPKDVGATLARGSHLWFVDDDDRFPADALSGIREAVLDHPNRLLVGRMWHGGLGRTLGRSVANCDVGAPQAVVPRVPGLPQWRYADGGFLGLTPDHAWITECVRLLGDPVYFDTVVCRLERQNFGKDV